MGKVVVLLLIGIVGIFGLSYYKNELIKKELTKELDSIDLIGHKEIECSGLLKSDCTIYNPTLKRVLIADSVIINDLDPTAIPRDGEFKKIPVSLSLKGVKYSLWDLLAQKREASEVGNFLKKYKQDYNIKAKLLIDSDGERVRGIKVLNLKADDKLIPYALKGEVSGLDQALIIQALDLNFDFSNKRAIFDDFVASMRECCIDDFPLKYKQMSNDELYDEFKHRLNEIDLGLPSLDQALLVISDDTKKDLSISIHSKSQTPISQVILPFFMLGPRVIDKYFDIKIEVR